MNERTYPQEEAAGGLRRWQFFAIVGLFWLYVTLSNVLYAYSMRMGIARVTNESLFAAWDARVLQHLLLLPVVLVSFWASLRVQWRPLLIALPLQLILGTVFAAVAYPAMLVAQMLLNAPEWREHMMGHVSSPFYLDPGFLSLWMASFVSFLPAYGFGLALVTGLALYTRFRNSELRVAELEREWTAARLAALRMQLSPHTLFNLLHTIRGQIEWDPAAAQAMVVQLGDLLRRLLTAGETEFTPLVAEIEFASLYLKLQQQRFADRLTLSLPDPQTLPDAWVPSLILQPLIENAVVHGLAGHGAAVNVSIEVQTAGQELRMIIRNTTGAATAGTGGIGLRNVRERLAVHFGERGMLLVQSAEAQLWSAIVRMPLLREPAPALAAGAKVPA